MNQTQITLKLSEVMPMEFAGNDDVITNCYDAFPFILFINDENYKSIVESLSAYWIEYYQKTQFGRLANFDKHKILQILNNFISLDKEITTRTSDYYTVATMLHLVNSNRNSDEITESYLTKLDNFGRLSNEFNLLYIKANVLRRRNKYPESIEECNKYKDQDFRFGYCGALALIGLVNKENERNVYKYKDKMDIAIKDLTKAYNEIAVLDIQNRNNFQASICSNIIYLASLYFLHSEEESRLELPLSATHIEVAQKYLDLLKELKSKETGEWDFLYPDFFHSEAFFEYATVKAFEEAGQPDNFAVRPKSGNWKTRVNSALIDIEKAIKYCKVEKKRRWYEQLKTKIKILTDKL